MQGLHLVAARHPDARHQGKAVEKRLTGPKGAHAVHGLLLGGPSRPDTRCRVEALRVLSQGSRHTDVQGLPPDMCRATCHAVTGEANPSGEMRNMSLTEAGTAIVVRANAKLGWRLTTAEYGLLKTSMVSKQLRRAQSTWSTGHGW